jgi:Cullin family/Cullin protein neddylation domain
MEAIESNLSGIKSSLIENVLVYLETGKFENRTNNAYVSAYSKVLELADIDENGKYLYDYYKKTIKSYSIQKVKPELFSLKGVHLLKGVALRWQNHKMLVYWMRKIFYYLDRYYIKNSNLDNLFLAGVKIFKEEIFNHIKENVKNALLQEIAEERNGSVIDINVIKETLLCFSQLGCTKFTIEKQKFDDQERLLWTGVSCLDVYKEDFEKYFLVESDIYYVEKGKKWISTLSCNEYLHSANKSFQDEERRLQAYLDPNTKDLINDILVNELVKNNAKTVSDMPGTGCVDMLKHDKRDELKLMFNIFKKHEACLSNITTKLSAHIEGKGSQIVSDPKLQEDAIEFTKSLLEFKSEIDGMIEYSFDNHSLFQRCRDMSFQNFMNKIPYSAHYIASYCDHEMKKGLKGVSEADTEKRLAALIKLFVCLHDRDVFIRYYTRFLAKRLLDETSVSDEAEQNMISKLKVECGHNIVNKISNMYQDKTLSENVMKEFKSLSHKGNPDGILLNVQILRNGCWPEQSPEPCKIPEELGNCFKKFESFYLNKHQGRNLTILLSYGTCEIGTLFAKKPYTCIINPYQTAILMLFNKNNSYALNELRDITGLSDNTLKSNLIPFFNPKSRLFTKPSSGKTINDTDLITLNLDFNSATLRVSFIPKKVKKAEVANKEDDKAVENERKYILDSVIVRIAKGRRQIKHQELITEVIRQVDHFKPQPPMIKGQIESLIQREFLARDEKDKTLYIYLP